MQDPGTALELILSRCCVLASEHSSVAAAHEQVLSEPVYAHHHHPPADNSAMDGYAIQAADTLGASQESKLPLKIVGRSRAGAPFAGVLGPGETVRIFTGALVPEGADSVEMQEYVVQNGDVADFSRAVKEGANIRRRGENFEPGSELMAAGAKISAAAVGLLCSAHIDKVCVHRVPRVAILGTGDELVSIENAKGHPETLVDSNGPMLSAYCSELGVEVVSCTTCDDTVESVRDWLIEMAQEVDAIISTGGASVGEHDVIAEAWEMAGIDTVFWKIAMKPGKPLRFGSKPRSENDSRPPLLVFALPGNPLSALTGFERYVGPALRKMKGHEHVEDPILELALSRDIRKKTGRTHFTQCTAKVTAEGLVLEPQNHQGSFMLRAAANSELVGVFPADADNLSSGSTVQAFVRKGGMLGKTLKPASDA